MRKILAIKAMEKIKSVKKLKKALHLTIKLFFSLSGFFVLPAQAAICHGAVFNPLTVDMSGFFPITIGSTTVESSDLPDTPNPDNPVCACGDFPNVQIGAALGYWEPMALMDVTRTPYCMVNLGGVQGSGPTQMQAGAVDTSDDSQANSFYHVHYYNYPLIKILFADLLGGSCKADGDVKIAYFSELDPTWNNETLSALIFPGTLVFTNPAIALFAQSSCLSDSTAAATGLAQDNLFYCAGSQGFMYPIMGKVIAHEGMAQATVLIVERAMVRLHRLGLVTDTNKDDLCHEVHDFIRPPKSRYRYQMVYPVVGAIAPFGRSTQWWWARVSHDPLQGDDTAYLIWRKRNCCFY